MNDAAGLLQERSELSMEKGVALSEIYIRLNLHNFPLVSIREKGYRQEMKCITLVGTLDSDVLPDNRKISILMLLLLLSSVINRILLLVSVDSVAGGFCMVGSRGVTVQ